jgi:ATP-binding cassette, subfamily B (MDR/TAP), member 1
MIGIRMSAAIRLHYLKCLFGQSIHVLDSMPPGAAAGTITGTANTLQLGISEKLGVFIEFNATIVAAVIIAFTYSWRLTLVTSSMLLFLILVVSTLLPFIVKLQSKLTKVRLPKLDNSSYSQLTRRRPRPNPLRSLAKLSPASEWS